MENNKENTITILIAILFLSTFLIKPHTILHTHHFYHSGILLLPNKQIITYGSLILMMLISFYLGMNTQFYLDNYNTTTSTQLRINIVEEKAPTDNKTGSSSGRTLNRLNRKFQEKQLNNKKSLANST